MPMSQNEIDSFHSFASEQLAGGHRDWSLEDLLRRWQSKRDEDETLSSIQRGVEGAEAGRIHLLDNVDANIRGKVRLPSRSR